MSVEMQESPVNVEISISGDSNISNYSEYYDEWDSVEEEECPDCYGTGLDRDEVYDCETCFGEGYIPMVDVVYTS